MVVYKYMQIYGIYLTFDAQFKFSFRSVAQTVCDGLHDQIEYLGLKVGPNPQS